MNALPTIADVYRILEDHSKDRYAVLLHIKARTKGPTWEGWGEISYAESKAPEHQKLLHAHANTGVRLGECDLCTIDCDTEIFRAWMLEHNPVLRQTLESKGANGCQFWGYFSGNRPHQVCALKVHKDSPLAVGARKEPDLKGMVQIGEFRAEGVQSVIRGIHEIGCDYTWPNPVKPADIVFEAIQWHRDIALSWLKTRKEPAYTGSSRAEDTLLKRAIRRITVESLWEQFGFPERSTNPVSSPFREDKKPSFSIFDQGRLFKDHGTGEGGDSFEFYKLATSQDAKAAFKPFVELAGLGEELRRAAPQHLVQAEERGEAISRNGANSPNSPTPQYQQPSSKQDKQRDTRGEENGEFASILPGLPVDWAENSANSPNSPGGNSQRVFFPPESILADYYEYAITQSEGADAYIIGAILPVIAAILGRNLWVPWSAYDGKLYPNIYSILAGPPGNLKSTSIYPAEAIARAILGHNRFLSHNYSPEGIFDSFFKHPDRLLVCSDAGSTIIKWSNPYDGQRLSHNFLTLFDCEPMSEGFRRNRKADDLDSQQRVTGPLSLSILFGATLSKCQFSDNSERDGLVRRVLYHIALTKARELDRPKPDLVWLNGLVRQFERLQYLKGEFGWEDAAQARFDRYKKEVQLRLDASDPFDESTRGRLSTLCVYVLKIAMLFQAARLCFKTSWMPADPGIQPVSPPLWLTTEVLELAIQYIEECFSSAQALASIANLKLIGEGAETLLANIRADFESHPADPRSVVATRSQLTRAYAHNPGRRSGLDVDEIYLRIIPYLIRSGDCVLLAKEGKKETYAFRVDS